MRKYVLIICIVLILISGCNNVKKTEPVNTYKTSSDRDEYGYYEHEIEVFELEKIYLEKTDDRNLLELCSALIFMGPHRTEFNKMVLKYYPILFKKLEPENTGFDYGFDSFYARHVGSLFAEDNKTEYMTKYYEYKQKAENIYIYSMNAYSEILLVDVTDSKDYEFLYQEAIDIYEQGKSEDLDIPSKISSATPLINYYESIGKEEDAERIREELRQFLIELGAYYDEDGLLMPPPIP